MSLSKWIPCDPTLSNIESPDSVETSVFCDVFLPEMVHLSVVISGNNLERCVVYVAYPILSDCPTTQRERIFVGRRAMRS